MDQSLDRRFLLGGLAGAAGISALAAMSKAGGGPLDPPAGAVAPSGKALTEVEPRTAINAVNTPGDSDAHFVISQPGSYYLASNTILPGGKHGIRIDTSDVTIDLCGFRFAGTPGPTYHGIRTNFTPLIRNTVIRNGTLSNWSGNGVDLATNSTYGCKLDNLHAGGCGIGMAAGSGVITNCTAHGNGVGIRLRMGGVIANCYAQQNSTNISGEEGGAVVFACGSNSSAGNGIVVASGAVRDCVSNNDAGAGVAASGGTSVIGCSVRESGTGIFCFNGSLVRGNTCYRLNTVGASTGYAFQTAGTRCRFEDNTAIGYLRGYSTDQPGNWFARNTASGNTSNWNVVAGNTLLVVQSATAGAVIGSTGGLSAGSTDPNANYSS